MPQVVRIRAQRATARQSGYAAQRDATIALMSASLSVRGLKLTRDIMRLNHTLGELNDDNFEEYGEWLYWITVMGEPSADEPWNALRTAAAQAARRRSPDQS